jgi:hypothetical protein
MPWIKTVSQRLALFCNGTASEILVYDTSNMF